MISQLIDAKPYHCGRIVRLLRPEHAAIMKRIGADMHRDLRLHFDSSSYRKAWLVDGQLMAIGGIEGPKAASSGMGWLALAADAPKVGWQFARMALREFDALFPVKHQIATLILKDDLDSVRFAYFLGFRVERIDTVNGVPVLAMICDGKIKKAA
jgi:hypothetical protein